LRKSGGKKKKTFASLGRLKFQRDGTAAKHHNSVAVFFVSRKKFNNTI
jgi:hypothetical protein